MQSISQAKRAILKALSNADLSQMDEDAAIAYIQRIIWEIVGIQGDIAATYAADLYDYIALQEGRRGLKSALISYGATESQLRNDAAHVVHMWLRGEDFETWICDKAEHYIRLAANKTMEQNAIRDGRKYARIPTSDHPCAFCIMLASRGFVYGSRMKAGEGNSYHNHCTCKVIASDSGDVEGYNQKDYIKAYVDGRNRAYDDYGEATTNGSNTVLNAMRKNLREDPEYNAHENQLRREWYQRNKERLKEERKKAKEQAENTDD